MTDVVLVNPYAADKVYAGLGDLVACEPPQWCRLIAGYLRDRGFDVDIIDAEALCMPAEAVAAEVEMIEDLKLVVLVVFGHQPSSAAQQMSGAHKLAIALDQAHGDFPVLIVGGNASALPEKTLRDEPSDYVCDGEGPLTIAGLLYGHELHLTPGLVWRDGEKIVRNPRAGNLSPDDLHGDAWDLLPMAKYRAHAWQCFGDLSQRQPYASIYTSLNCPYKCSFCCISAPFHDNRYLMRSPKAVVAEIKMLYERYGVRTLKITDEMFVLNERHYKAICKGLIDAGLGDKLNVWAYSRIDTVKPKNLALLRAAGVRWLALGIESGSKHVRDGARKALRNDDIVSVVRSIQAADINVIGNYIFGLPDDDHGSMQATLDLALECRTEFANFYSAMAYPGSQLHEQAAAEALPDSWLGYSQHAYETQPMATAHCSAAEVLRFRDEAFVRYFTDPGYLMMIRHRFGLETVQHVMEMTKHRIKRKLLEAA